MDLLKLMGDRYSCRRYSTEAAKIAPTAHNEQPQRIYVVKSNEGKARLMKDLKLLAI